MVGLDPFTGKGNSELQICTVTQKTRQEVSNQAQVGAASEDDVSWYFSGVF